jgi:biotin carboxyl carrier protein
VTDLRLRVAGTPVDSIDGWAVSWLDRGRGIARLQRGAVTLTAVIEGAGAEWQVSLGGRRIPVVVQTWREQLLAEAEAVAGARSGPIDIRATLPGLVVAVAVAVGTEVAPGDDLLTVEAMKMQNEVRAPRAGRVAEIGVASGQTVATGDLLLRLE